MATRHEGSSRASPLWSRLRMVGVSSGLGTAGKLLQFAALAFLATQLVPAEYGRFSIVQILLFGMASIASSSFAFAANTRAADITSANPGVAFSTVLRVVAADKRFVYAGIAGLGAVTFPALYLVLSGGLTPTPLIAALGAACSAIVITDTFIGVASGTGRTTASACLDGARGAGSAIALTVAALFLPAVWTSVGLVVVEIVIASVALLMMSTRPSAHRAASVVVPPGPVGVVRAGVVANTAAQLGTWALVWAVQMVGGLEAVGAFALANRFATLVLLAPAFLSKNMLGALRRDRMSGNGQRSNLLGFYIAVVSCGSVLAAALAVSVGASFPVFRGTYSNFLELLIVLSVAAVLRAVATSLGVICVSRDLLRTWVLSDVAALIVLALVIGVAFLFSGGLVSLLFGLVASNATALLWRALGLRRTRGVMPAPGEANLVSR